MSAFEKLQARYLELLKLEQEKTDILSEVQAYIEDAKNTSDSIGLLQEREQLRANLRYWSGYVYDHTTPNFYPTTDLRPYSGRARSMTNWVQRVIVGGVLLTFCIAVGAGGLLGARFLTGIGEGEMDLILYNLVNSSWFWVFAVVWVLLGLMWATQREALVERLKLLVSRPPISADDPDEEHKDDGFYPGRLFVYLARILDSFTGFIKGQQHIVLDPAHPMRTLAYFMLFLTFGTFAFADYIAIANGLSVFADVDILLTPFVTGAYGVAVGIAIFVSTITGFSVIFQANAEDSWMLFGGDTKRSNRSIAMLMSAIVVLIALSVAFFLGLEKLRVLGYLETSSTLEWFSQFGVHVLILINGTLSASLIFNEALYGMVVAGFVMAWVCIVVFGIVRHLLDYVVRLVIALLDILLYIIFTPIFEIVAGVTGIYKQIAR